MVRLTLRYIKPGRRRWGDFCVDREGPGGPSGNRRTACVAMMLQALKINIT
jgi:hypothetical protein